MVDEERWWNWNTLKVKLYALYYIILVDNIIIMMILIIVMITKCYLLIYFIIRRNWKRRWFVLKDETLSYYDSDQEGAKASGVIDIRKAM